MENQFSMRSIGRCSCKGYIYGAGTVKPYIANNDPVLESIVSDRREWAPIDCHPFSLSRGYRRKISLKCQRTSDAPR